MHKRGCKSPKVFNTYAQGGFESHKGLNTLREVVSLINVLTLTHERGLTLIKVSTLTHNVDPTRHLVRYNPGIAGV